jgi:diguanylate cyclase (GGDEF)-like protein
VALLLLEVDRLDRVRDQCGEEVVQAILREAGEAVAGSVRGYDLAARVGPQGFGVLLPGADRVEAEVERIRASVAAIEFPALGRVTVSLGLAAFPEAVDAVPTLLEAAEQALLIGRRSGDAVVAAPSRKTDEPPPAAGSFGSSRPLALRSSSRRCSRPCWRRSAWRAEGVSGERRPRRALRLRLPGPSRSRRRPRSRSSPAACSASAASATSTSRAHAT